MPRRRRCENLKILGHRLSDIGCLADYWTGGDRGSSYLSKGRGGEANHVGRGGNEERATGRDPPYDTLIPSPERQRRRQCGESPFPPTNVNKRRDRGKSPPSLQCFCGAITQDDDDEGGGGQHVTDSQERVLSSDGKQVFFLPPFPCCARDRPRRVYVLSLSELQTHINPPPLIKKFDACCTMLYLHVVLYMHAPSDATPVATRKCSKQRSRKKGWRNKGLPLVD